MSQGRKQWIFSILFILFTAIQLSGQNRNTPLGTSKQARSEDAKLIKDRTLLVGLYGNNITDDRTKVVVNSFWTYNKEIIFLPKEQIAIKIKNNETKFAILSIDLVNVYTSPIKIGSSNQFIRFSLKLGEKYDSKRPVYYQDVISELQNDNIVLNKREIIFAVCFIQNHLNARYEGKNRMLFTLEVIENSGKLKNKTLLVDKSFIDKSLTKEDIKNNYPYSFEITDIKSIEKAQTLKDKKYAYVEIAPIGGAAEVMMHYVVDCENGNIISYGEYFNGAFDKFSNWVTVDHIKCYVKNSEVKKK